MGTRNHMSIQGVCGQLQFPCAGYLLSPIRVNGLRKDALNLWGCLQHRSPIYSTGPRISCFRLSYGVRFFLHVWDSNSVQLPRTKERWQFVGGNIESLTDARSAQLGDVQRDKWFKRFLFDDEE